MERREQRARGGRRGPSPGGCEAVGGAPGGGAPDGGEAVVQRTQVVLLAGEPWGLDGGQTVLSSFAHHVVPSSGAAGPPPPPSSPTPPGALFPPPPPLPSSPSGRLIFFLCRASSLRDREARLREVLRGVRGEQQQQPPQTSGCPGGGGGGAPAVLVGVVVQPPPGQEEEALRRLEGLLRDAFPAGPEEGGQPGAPLEIHTALFAPGRPQGALELRRLAHKPSAAPLSLDTALVMQVLGAVVSLGTLAYGGYYAYNNLLLE